MSKNRSRRLLKKMKLGEFKELGFEYSAELTKPMNIEAQDKLIDAFLEEAIEKRNLALGGWLEGGFVSLAARGSVTEEDRTAVEAWLKSCQQLKNVTVGGLVDAWYGWDER